MVGRQELIAAFRRAEERLETTILSPRSLIVESLGLSDDTFAAVDSSGSWALVVVAQKSTKRIPGLSLTLLSAAYGVTYQLHKYDAVEPIRVSVLRCGTTDPSVQALFATLCAALLEALPPAPTDGDLEREVSKWVELFWRLQSPARATVIGLIGEVTLLESVVELGEWIRAWHANPLDNLDFAFSTPPLSVEVKATSSQQRVHELTINQAAPPTPGDHYFASVIVELRETGVRLGDVLTELADQLAGTPESLLLWTVVAETCGSSLEQFAETRYMRDGARKSLQLYRSDSVPQPLVRLPLPPGVSGLQFRSDFSSAEPIPPAKVLAARSNPV